MNHLPTGPEYWRSLEQLAATPELRNRIESEFPTYDPQEIVTVSRRRFMKLMAASMALAGLTLSGCRRWPQEKLAPYTGNHPNHTPGALEQYATVMELSGVAMGLLATSFDGRPIKIEGNPSHPFFKTSERYGSADAYAQASVLELYDPDRSRYPVDRTGQEPKPATWEQFAAFAATHFDALRGKKGAGFAILSEPATGPSVAYMKKRVLEAFPQAKWYEYEPLTRDNEMTGSKLAFNDIFRPVLHLDKADTVVLFDADILGHHPAHIRYASDWAKKRRSADQGQMSRVYMTESAFTATGSAADIRLPNRSARIELMLQVLASKLGIASVSRVAGLSAEEARFVDSVLADIRKSPATAVVVAGSHLSPHAHALTHAINLKLGAVGATLDYLDEPIDERPTHIESITALVNDITAGRVQTLLILGGNPAYDAPADLGFAKALAAVPMSLHLGLYHNETSLASKWHLPRAHYLESWSDARAYDFSISIAQPLILPLYGGKSIIELLAIVTGDEMTDGEQIVRRTFVQTLPKEDFEKHFRRILHDGIQDGSASNTLKPDELKLQPPTIAAPIAASTGFDIRFLPSPAVYDGCFANNGWLQETPDSLTKLTWDNAALISPKDATQLSISTGDLLRITLGNQSLIIPAFILPGQPQGVIGLPLGYGRGAAGNIGNGVGADTYRLRTSAAMYVASGARIEKTGNRYELAVTQDHHTIDELAAQAKAHRLGHENESGKLLREATFAEYLHDKDFVRKEDEEEGEKKHEKVHLQLYEPPAPIDSPHRWGMAIDMNSCTGCGGCVVACQAENNIPVVGKTQVLREREMHWIRNDRYFKGSPDNPTVTYQTLMCVHCENAPCEEVCPVAATVHDSEGLNTQVYNRCIGTRYCSNNCPYKVRRFNYLDYHSQDPRGTIPRPWLGIPDTEQREKVDQIKRMVFNPDVTVRMRGVMEKCTYCVQRIHRVTIDKRNRNESVNDGDIVTACQQACPTQAIVFGDLKDPNSRVSQLHKNHRAYAMLQLLDTRPRTMHLAKLRNTSEQPTTRKTEGHA